MQYPENGVIRMFTLYVGKNRKPHQIKDRGCRTQAQFEAVQSFAGDIDFACNNPFEVEYEGEEYNRTFAFLFYRHGSDELRMAKITPTGRVKFLDADKEVYTMVIY